MQQVSLTSPYLVGTILGSRRRVRNRESWIVKAAVVWKPGEKITIEEVSINKPVGREVLIRTAYAGVCHSDLHFADATYPFRAMSPRAWSRRSGRM